MHAGKSYHRLAHRQKHYKKLGGGNLEKKQYLLIQRLKKTRNNNKETDKGEK